MSGAVPPPLLYLPGLQKDKRAFCCSRLITECQKVACDRLLKVHLEFRAPYLNQCPKWQFCLHIQVFLGVTPCWFEDV